MDVGEQLGRRLCCLDSGVTKEEEEELLEQFFSSVCRHFPTHGFVNFSKVRHRS
jgi:hypothetical protein